jgi:probable biosynthetic protein (TIGR04099 family)
MLLLNMMPSNGPATLTGAQKLLETALCPDILLGMPHLTPFGLSRTWLLKELGHRHWLLLARCLGLGTPDFRTAEGDEAYAAIAALKIDARLSRARSNAVLSISSSLYPTSESRMESMHALALDGRAIGTIVLQSVFVARTGSDNRSIQRAVIRQFRSTGEARESLLVQDIAALRLFNTEDEPPSRTMAFQPCPFEEFNGAGLFYFAEYVGLLGRAFCHWDGAAAADRLDRPLSMMFLGNIDKGDVLEVSLRRSSSMGLAGVCEIRRQGQILSRAFIG